MTLTLLQFPISHYCEKVRWALDFKSVPHQKRNLVPGVHLLVMKRLGLKSAVPAIKHENGFVQGSSQIIDYLDERYPDRLLTPADPTRAKETREWERFADDNIGVHLRRVMYHTLLNHPEIVIPFFTIGGPWYGPFFLRRMFPALQSRMRTAMEITDETAKASEEALATAIETLSDRLRSQKFIVGDSFTRADLASASLLAPLLMPRGYGLTPPETFPPAIEALMARFRSSLGWVEELYENYR